MGTELKTVVFIPTYNEAENIGQLIENILEQQIDNLDILVIDDNSPDGTSEIVKRIKNKHIHIIHRKGKRGRGIAGRLGYKKALELGAKYIIEMDADFSHNPIYIKKMLKEIQQFDVVLGSRMIKGGKDLGRGIFRRVITIIANMYIRIILRIPVRDCNSGFRCFRKEVFEKIKPENISSEGPAIVQEVLYKCYLKGFSIKEIPIVFKERKKGKSTLSFSKLLQGYTTVISLKLKKMNNSLKF